MPHSWRADTVWCRTRHAVGHCCIDFSGCFVPNIMSGYTARPPNGTMASIVPYKLSFRCTTNDFMFLRGGVRVSRPTGYLRVMSPTINCSVGNGLDRSGALSKSGIMRFVIGSVRRPEGWLPCFPLPPCYPHSGYNNSPGSANAEPGL